MLSYEIPVWADCARLPESPLPWHRDTNMTAFGQNLLKCFNVGKRVAGTLALTS